MGLSHNNQYATPGYKTHNDRMALVKRDPVSSHYCVVAFLRTTFVALNQACKQEVVMYPLSTVRGNHTKTWGLHTPMVNWSHCSVLSLKDCVEPTAYCVAPVFVDICMRVV